MKGIAMKDIRGPAGDPEAFRVEGHCCSIRLPVLTTLTDEGLRFELTPQARAELAVTGMRLPDNPGASEDPGKQTEPLITTPGNGQAVSRGGPALGSPVLAAKGSRGVWACYGVSLAVFLGGVALASVAYPGGFDWQYTVISRLASRKHNPEGSLWFSIGLAVSMLLLWPVFERIRPRGRGAWPRTATLSLRAGLVFAALVGVERALFLHLSALVDKSHEALALLAFVGLYVGLLAVYVQRVASGEDGRRRSLAWMSPLVLVGLGSLGLYALQRDVGWVKPNWRELGVPVWQSFACWQWLMVAVLWSAVARLLATTRART
jgi:hypothetical protein